VRKVNKTAKINGKTITIKHCGESENSPCIVEIKKGDEVIIKPSLQKFYQEGLWEKKTS